MPGEHTVEGHFAAFGGTVSATVTIHRVSDQRINPSLPPELDRESEEIRRVMQRFAEAFKPDYGLIASAAAEIAVVVITNLFLAEPELRPFPVDKYFDRLTKKLNKDLAGIVASFQKARTKKRRKRNA